MTEGKDKENDPQTEENADSSAEEILPESKKQTKGPQKAVPSNTEDSRIDAADESADPEDARSEKQSDALDDEKNISAEMQAVEDFDLNLLLDIPLEITVELGRARIQIQELLDLGPGSTVTLSKLEGEPVDILANDKLIARGEVVLQNKKYGIRITEIASRIRRIKSLNENDHH